MRTLFICMGVLCIIEFIFIIAAITEEVNREMYDKGQIDALKDKQKFEMIIQYKKIITKDSFLYVPNDTLFIDKNLTKN
jgi:hypothetical protein